MLARNGCLDDRGFRYQHIASNLAEHWVLEILQQTSLPPSSSIARNARESNIRIDVRGPRLLISLSHIHRCDDR